MLEIRNKKEMLKKMPRERLEAGYMRFLLPRTEISDEELVWGWVDQENKLLLENTTFNGEIDAYLLNQPQNDFRGRLRWGDEIKVECNCSSMPVLSAAWIETYLL